MIKLQKFIDKYIFSIPCLIFRSFGKLNKSKIKKILVIKNWALGDSVVLLPALHAIKKQFPKAELHVLAHPKNKVIFEGQKFVDKIIDFGALNILKSFRKYDVCIDAEPFLNVSAFISFLSSGYRIGFSHGIKSNLYNETILFNKKQHMVQNYLDFARKLGSDYDTNELIPLVIGNRDKKIVSNYLKKEKVTSKDFVVGISSGVAESVKYRAWSSENFAKLADELIEKKMKVVFLDSKDNKPVIDKIKQKMRNTAIDASGLFSVKQASELISRCNVFVSNDSGLMHISAAMGIKTIGLFGPNTPVLWAPYGKGNVSLFKPKKGCPYLDNTNPELIPKCLTKEQLTCMDAITVSDVLHAIEKLK